MGVNPWSFGELATNINMNLEATLPSIWNYLEEQNVDESKLKYMMEMESLRNNVDEELRKRDETIVQLVQLVGSITRERDELKEQLQFVLSKFRQSPAANITEISPVVSQFQSDSPRLKHAIANSAVTDSDNLVSYGSEQTSPELSSVNMADSGKVVSAKFDRVSAVIDSLAMKKPLPEKGKFLQSVLESGPLLQTLILAGPLPQWQNPPPLPAKAPKMNNSSVVVQRPSQFVYRSSPVMNDYELNRASRIQFPGNSCLGAGKKAVVPVCVGSYVEPAVKRHRF